ncbi:glutaminyl-peptide cyclotransferase [Cruoricaptor ignavus]|uniref:Glutaminyl-peptide cyclotransferase n=1 Tax=Cruoricaptor ignavus TaxID=1118202 RepID=A0A7M1T330_9FLAO|nr:glutaminyl-peptide cyclotransferase [Cruoricaptor ignavus]QOR74151.1 glutaminyl-peptide cyclotransferase [Cruoricaptor ignavus]
MKKTLVMAIAASIFATSCSKDKEILNTLADYNLEMESEGYHFGDKIKLPESVLKNVENVSLSFGNHDTADLRIDPKKFTLGDNAVTFVIRTKDGKELVQDATINVFARNPEKQLSYTLVREYPHDVNNFVQGFQLEGNMIYESDGQNGSSQILKYALGSTTATAMAKQPAEVFSEGCTIVGDKVYQLTWQNKKGFIYNKYDLKLIGEFPYPNVMGEGWGLTYDGEHLIASDGTKNLYFLSPEDPSKLVRYISVAGNSQAYNRLNELEYHDGHIYANVWQQAIVLKINPENGEVLAIIDFSQLAKENTKGQDDVLNGITFKGENMLVTGKNWSKIYEVSIQ